MKSKKDVLCRQVTDTFPGANGLNLWKDRLFVGDSKNGTVTIFEIDKDKSVTQLQMVVSRKQLFKRQGILLIYMAGSGRRSRQYQYLAYDGRSARFR